ncbi:MAG: Succinate dehydrogenase, flavoprotein subunit [Deltaproteobacteria bacterium]|nr:Succinate dehydrogenase, flavoprotein subunit [Deltaproteobacteria bacterium]
MPHLSTDVLIVGAGGAGMYAAIAAARGGAAVLLLDKGQVGRGGATIMAQMTVAVALGEQEPDSVQLHLQDTLNAGRGLCNEELSLLLCADGPARIREMDEWGTRWARENGHIKQEMAPGHSVKRCCYVDFLNTGPAVAATLRRKVGEIAAIRRISNLAVVEILVRDGRAVGALALNQIDGQFISIEAKAVILAAGGLTKLFARNSASANMGGEAYALALWAGAQLVDMEFVQFFPIGHLAPRLVGMDPIMWDPFRYKLGGKLLNGKFEEFIDRYGSTDFGKYNATRDVAAYAILKEVEAGRGTPHGGAYLDFRHIGESQLRAAFGPVIDRLLTNGIDLAKTPVEVGPMAHYHMGGVRVDVNMQTRVAGLYAAGEAVGGANGANRLSGNAITEAFVFGERAGSRAAEQVKKFTDNWHDTLAREAIDGFHKAREADSTDSATPIALQAELQELMWEKAGPFRTGAKLSAALARIGQMQRQLAQLPVGAEKQFNLDLQDWFELRAMLTTAKAIVQSALARNESRGAHQREDFPAPDDSLLKNQVLELQDGALATTWIDPVRLQKNNVHYPEFRS